MKTINITALVAADSEEDAETRLVKALHKMTQQLAKFGPDEFDAVKYTEAKPQKYKDTDEGGHQGCFEPSFPTKHWVCTRKKGHTGMHEAGAGGGMALALWKERPKEDADKLAVGMVVGYQQIFGIPDLQPRGGLVSHAKVPEIDFDGFTDALGKGFPLAVVTSDDEWHRAEHWDQIHVHANTPLTFGTDTYEEYTTAWFNDLITLLSNEKQGTTFWSFSLEVMVHGGT